MAADLMCAACGQPLRHRPTRCSACRRPISPLQSFTHRKVRGACEAYHVDCAGRLEQALQLTK